MVCPKLKDGECEQIKLVCPQTYDLKMINHEKCKVFKESGGLLKSLGGRTRIMSAMTARKRPTKAAKANVLHRKAKASRKGQPTKRAKKRISRRK